MPIGVLGWARTTGGVSASSAPSALGRLASVILIPFSSRRKGFFVDARLQHPTVSAC